MKNIYLTKAQELNLKYAGLDLGDETEKKLEIIMEDNHTKKEAVDYLCNGSVVYEKEEFEKLDVPVVYGMEWLKKNGFTENGMLRRKTGKSIKR